MLVDDGSRDRTWDVLESLSRQHGFVIARHPRNLGLAAAWATGFSASSGTLVCTIDADLQYRPEDIAELHRTMLARGVDLVQGARRWTEITPRSRYLLSRAPSLLLNQLFGMELDDNKSGFLLCRREVFARLLEEQPKYRYFQNLVMVAAHAAKIRSTALEVAFEPRRHGSSFLTNLPLRTMARALVDVGRAVVEYRIR